MRAFTVSICYGIALFAGASSPIISHPAPQSQPSADAKKQQFQLEAIKKRPVARVGTHEVTAGEILEAARVFFPKIEEELNSAYGDWFFSSDTFDEWIDAYIDLLVLARHERSNGVMPDAAAIETAITDRGKLALVRIGKKMTAETATQPSRDLELAKEQVRRKQGFDAAREARLDQLVAPVTDLPELRRALYKNPGFIVNRVRARHLTIATRDPGKRRFDRERREHIREDAERVLSRLRGGESFADVSAQVTGRAESRPKDTMPWISETSPLPVAVLRALFAAKEGEFVGPIETGDGFYIGKVEETSKAPVPDFDKAAPTLQQLLRREDQYDLLLKLRGQVEIVVY